CRDVVKVVEQDRVRRVRELLHDLRQTAPICRGLQGLDGGVRSAARGAPGYANAGYADVREALVAPRLGARVGGARDRRVRLAPPVEYAIPELIRRAHGRTADRDQVALADDALDEHGLARLRRPRD